MWTTPRRQKLQGNVEGAPQLCEFYLQELYWVLTVNIGEKYSYFQQRGSGGEQGGEGTIFKMPEGSVLLKKACLQENLFYRSLTSWGFIGA